MRKKRVGKVTKIGDVSPWPHEEATAKALALCGYDVTFIKASDREYEHSADAYVDNVLWEFKAPKGRKMSAVERNLRRGKDQSNKIVFDSRRMKGLPDEAIIREILSKAPFISDIECVRYINKHGKSIDIYNR